VHQAVGIQELAAVVQQHPQRPEGLRAEFQIDAIPEQSARLGVHTKRPENDSIYSPTPQF